MDVLCTSYLKLCPILHMHVIIRLVLPRGGVAKWVCKTKSAQAGATLAPCGPRGRGLSLLGARTPPRRGTGTKAVSFPLELAHSQQYLKEYDSQFVKTAEIFSLLKKAIVESPFRLTPGILARFSQRQRIAAPARSSSSRRFRTRSSRMRLFLGGAGGREGDPQRGCCIRDTARKVGGR